MKQILVGLIFLVSGAVASADQSAKLDSQNGSIEFQAKGPLVKVNGKGEGAKGILLIKENKVTGSLKLDLTSLDTGISLRDDHMKNKYLQVKDHPEAVLELTEVILPKNFKGKTDFKGVLSLHGVQKPVVGKIKLKGIKSGKVQMSADFKIKFSDFNIELPSFKLVSVGEDIKIKVKSKVSVSEEQADKPQSTALVNDKENKI